MMKASISFFANFILNHSACVCARPCVYTLVAKPRDNTGYCSPGSAHLLLESLSFRLVSQSAPGSACLCLTRAEIIYLVFYSTCILRLALRSSGLQSKHLPNEPSSRLLSFKNAHFLGPSCSTASWGFCNLPSHSPICL